MAGALDVVADTAGLAVVEVLPIADADAGVVVVLYDTGASSAAAHLCCCCFDRFLAGLAGVQALSWCCLDLEVDRGGCNGSGRWVEGIHFLPCGVGCVVCARCVTLISWSMKTGESIL